METLHMALPVAVTTRPDDPRDRRVLIEAIRDRAADAAERALLELWDAPPDETEPIFGVAT